MAKKPCSRACYLVVLSFVPIKIVLWIQPSITAIRLVPSDVDLFAARTSWNFFRIMSDVRLGPKEYMYIWYRIYIWWLFVGGKSDKLSATLGCVLAAAWWFVSLFFCKGNTVNIVLSNCACSSKFSTWKKIEIKQKTCKWGVQTREKQKEQMQKKKKKHHHAAFPLKAT